MKRERSVEKAREKREGLRLCGVVVAVCFALGECPARPPARRPFAAVVAAG